MKMIQTKNIHTLLRGASVLSCGGGLAFSEQVKLLQRYVSDPKLIKGIELLPPSAVPDNACCVTVSVE